MRILNLGSLNLDKIYTVQHFVQPGETIKALNYKECCGGKGLNQSIALASAGTEVYHAGVIGNDGDKLLEMLVDSGVRINYIKKSNNASGHAIIQVDETGQNSIIIYGGANNEITTEYIDEVIGHFCENDILLLQNEISNVNYAIQMARQRGMTVVFNPSPINSELKTYNLDQVNYFILNEIEGKILAETESEAVDEIMRKLKEKYPKAIFVLTLGTKGSYYFNQSQTLFQDIYRTETIDTTGAGDVFCGYFISGLVEGREIQDILQISSMASSIAVSRRGAAPSIPKRGEVLQRIDSLCRIEN